jgi:hypothetical protein
MVALLRIVLALLTMSGRAATLGPAHELLPARVRLSSFGFASVAFAFFAVALTRHFAVAGHDLVPVLASLVMYFAFLLYYCGSKYAAELTLLLAVSIGVDIGALVLGILGMDITSDAFRYRVLAWEVLASIVAIVRFRRARRGEAPA